MEEKKDIKETEIQALFIDLLDRPDDFSEEELKNLLTDKINRENLHVLQLSRKAYLRRQLPAPDVNEAWEKFRQQMSRPTLQKRRIIMFISLLTAAIIITGIFLLHFPQQTITQEILAKAEIKAQQTASGKQIQLYSINGKRQTISNGTVIFLNTATGKQAMATEKDDIKTITIPKGKTLKVILSDGTEVWLNAASTITFPVPFDEDRREIRLNGEAYFKVKHENKRPFIVATGNMAVTVLGTEFDVRSYADESPCVTLVKGLVNLANKTGTESVLLHPNEQATLEADGNLSITPADTYAVTQWVEGYFYFDNAPLIKVIHELARWYDMDILIRNKKFINEPIHFSAERKDNVFNTIDNLNRLQKANITIEGTNIVLQ